jgi:dTDP-glucose pyrophosphorylase
VIAVVLARGAGRRMRERSDEAGLTAEQARAAAGGRKAMMPIGDAAEARPFLDYVLASLADAGCARVCLVISDAQADVRRRYDEVVVPSRFQVRFAQQRLATGTAHAVLAAEACVGDEPFLVVNADNLYPVAVLRDLMMLDGPGLPAFTRADLVASSNIPPERIASFGLIEVDADGSLAGIAEKPGEDVVIARGPNALVSMNAWRFDRRIFDACRDVPLSVRGEYELPEAVALAVARGVCFRVVQARGPVLDLSRPRDVPDVSRRLAGFDVTL